MSLGKLLDKLVRTNNPPMWHDDDLLNDSRTLSKEEFLAKYSLQTIYDSIQKVEEANQRDELVQELNEYFSDIK